MNIQAIETRYKGYRFRSRLEARWAVFFDSLDIRYEYEPQGFDLPKVGRYLPDFWIPEQAGVDGNIWIEVKGQRPTEEEENRASVLARQSGNDVFVFFGGIPLPINDFVLDGEPDSALLHSAQFFVDSNGEEIAFGDLSYKWCECLFCRRLGIQYDGRSARLSCGPKCHPKSDRDHNVGSPRLLAAYQSARSARFEGSR